MISGIMRLNFILSKRITSFALKHFTGMLKQMKVCMNERKKGKGIEYECTCLIGFFLLLLLLFNIDFFSPPLQPVDGVFALK